MVIVPSNFTQHDAWSFVCLFFCLGCLMKGRGCKTLNNSVTLRYMKMIADPVRKQGDAWSLALSANGAPEGRHLRK